MRKYHSRKFFDREKAKSRITNHELNEKILKTEMLALLNFIRLNPNSAFYESATMRIKQINNILNN